MLFSDGKRSRFFFVFCTQKNRCNYSPTNIYGFIRFTKQIQFFARIAYFLFAVFVDIFFVHLGSLGHHQCPRRWSSACHANKYLFFDCRRRFAHQTLRLSHSYLLAVRHIDFSHIHENVGRCLF